MCLCVSVCVCACSCMSARICVHGGQKSTSGAVWLVFLFYWDRVSQWTGMHLTKLAGLDSQQRSSFLCLLSTRISSKCTHLIFISSLPLPLNTVLGIKPRSSCFVRLTLSRLNYLSSLLLLFLWDRFSHILGWPGTCYVAETTLELPMFLSQELGLPAFTTMPRSAS